MIGRRKRRDEAPSVGAAPGTGGPLENVTIARRAPAPEPLDHDPAVPAGVLSELLAAFTASPTDVDSPAAAAPTVGEVAATSATPTYDFDDPSIDRLLEITTDDTPPDASVPMPTPVIPSTPATPQPPLDPGMARSSAAPAPAPAAPAVPAPAPSSPSSPGPTRILIGGDDELPDPVYLDEALDPSDTDRHRPSRETDSSGDRATIVIADLDDVEDVEVSAEPGRRPSGSIDPRLRARRVAVRRAEGRRRLFWVAIVGGVIVLIVGALAVLASSVFGVEQIEVQGAVYTDPARLAEITERVEGDPILLVDTRSIERELEAIAWVEQARVTTDFPHRLTIDIRERQPVATFVGSDGRFRIIDRDSRVLDVIDGLPLAPMLVTGTHPDTELGQFAGPSYASAAQLVIALPAEIRRITTSVGVDSATGDLSMLLNDTVQVRLGAANDLPVKLARLLQKVRDGLDDVEQLDVSTDEIGA